MLPKAALTAPEADSAQRTKGSRIQHPMTHRACSHSQQQGDGTTCHTGSPLRTFESQRICSELHLPGVPHLRPSETWKVGNAGRTTRVSKNPPGDHRSETINENRTRSLTRDGSGYTRRCSPSPGGNNNNNDKTVLFLSFFSR